MDVTLTWDCTDRIDDKDTDRCGNNISGALSKMRLRTRFRCSGTVGLRLGIGGASADGESHTSASCTQSSGNLGEEGRRDWKLRVRLVV